MAQCDCCNRPLEENEIHRDMRDCIQNISKAIKEILEKLEGKPPAPDQLIG